MSSCGIKGTDTISIDDNFKGNRTFDIVFDADTLAKVVDGKEGVKNFLKKNIEKPLNYSIVEDKENSLKVKIDFAFANLNEYKKIVNELYKKGDVKEEIFVEFNSSDKPPFVKGMKFMDNTIVNNLFKYLDTKAFASKIVKSTSANSIFDQSDIQYNVTLNGDNIITSSAGDKLFDDSAYLGPYEYFVVTSPADKSNNSFNRKFNLIFNKDNFDKLASDWQKHFDKSLKFDDKVVKDDKVVVSANLENVDQKTINDVTSKIFDSESNFSFVSEESVRDLARKLSINDSIKNTNFDFNISGGYFYEPHKISELNYTNIDEFLKENSREIDANKAFFVNSYELVYHSYDEPYIFNKLNIETKINGKDDIKRTLKFTIDDEEQKALINETLTKYLENNSIKYESKDKELIVSYGGKIFKDENLKLFSQNPIMEYRDKGLFKYNILYSDNSYLKDIRAKEIDIDVKSPMFSKLNPLSKPIEDSYDNKNSLVTFNLNLSYDVVKFSAIIIPIVLIALVAVLVVLIKKKKINFSYEPASSASPTQIDNPITAYNENAEDIDFIDDIL